MKTAAKIAGIILAIAMLPVALFGCGPSKDLSGSKYLGTWDATSASMSGLTLDVNDLFDGFTFDLKSDGKCVMTIDGDSNTGSWDETDGGFIVEGEFTVTVNGNTGTTEYEGVTLSFTHSG